MSLAFLLPPPLPGRFWRPDTHHSAIQKPTGLAAETCSLRGPVYSALTPVVTRDSDRLLTLSTHPSAHPSNPRPLFPRIGKRNPPPTRPLLPSALSGGTHPPLWRSTRLRKAVASNVVVEVDPAVTRTTYRAPLLWCVEWFQSRSGIIRPLFHSAPDSPLRGSRSNAGVYEFADPSWSGRGADGRPVIPQTGP